MTLPPTASPPQKTRPARRGRPPAAETGLVEERMLDAATTLFLEQGFGRTTLDKVSQLSGAGKSALYSRYADKAALFATVVERSIQKMFADMSPTPADIDVRKRLRHVGVELANSLLVPRCIALMRITAAEASNFPDLASMAYRVSFEGSVRCVARALAPDRLADPTDIACSVAARFVELALQPISFQATFATDFEVLRDRCADHVDDAIFYLDAKGLLRPWDLPAQP